MTDYPLKPLQNAAGVMRVPCRQRILRLRVEKALATDDSIIIRHSIPVPEMPPTTPPEVSHSVGESANDKVNPL